MSSPEINNYTGDKRQAPRNRFRWVRRLMQGQNRVHHVNLANQHDSNSQRPQTTSSDTHMRNTHAPRTRTRRSASDSATKSSEDNQGINSDEEGNADLTIRDFTSPDDRSIGALSDQISDNISTIPLKSIISSQSTKSASIISDNQHDQTSLIASTAETSLAPSSNTNYTFAPNNNTGAGTPTGITFGNTLSVASPIGLDRDSESIVTLASSSRRIRRRSIDTNCSTTAIPPASIMERLSVQPTVGNSSTYATSVRTSDRTSQFDASQHYDDQSSSVKSFN
ncbi:uncharacterized protein SPAPADRAFT_59126 [Spathaspora passalidarum NRRL Y-27907]|uniref:Uncharacterized protein n=1 Tax=Spathaspora passalidarum (strain NRRL Y-27907 / 11-Y1) TaxID=619300 RepID=G3AIV4_SPAPN|nr:uncharacterized protein SPAPADRAFT_59126 [Spathaspora passalidarum NRRL Y-27907]EGW33765.1 hypothetical protein SPAPADRAFT_59126 [Spathaspora passalidarum NRRL Y-27907]